MLNANFASTWISFINCNFVISTNVFIMMKKDPKKYEGTRITASTYIYACKYNIGGCRTRGSGTLDYIHITMVYFRHQLQQHQSTTFVDLLNTVVLLLALVVTTDGSAVDETIEQNSFRIGRIHSAS